MTAACTCRVAIHDLNRAISTTLHFGLKQHCGLCIRENIVMQQDQGGTELFYFIRHEDKIKMFASFRGFKLTDQTGTLAH